MRRATLTTLALVGVVLPALASDHQLAIVQGTGIRTATLTEGAKVAVQCPNIDGGAGQKVFYRPGGSCSGCTTVDAGYGDVLMDFTVNSDPYPVTLAAKESLIHLRSYDPAVALWCTVVGRSP